MEPYKGFEPEVGEIRAVRTFRIGPNGLLYPLFSDVAWSAETNTARCKLAGMQAFLPDQDTVHETPEPDCTCGFYAYASDVAAAQEYPSAQHVLAVVACWGRVIAGTRGIRAQHARVEALWMSAAVPPDLAAMVAERYPDTTVYTDKQLMLTEHAPTELDCYEPEEQRYAPRLGMRLAVVTAIGLGLTPVSWLLHNSDLLVVWLLELTVFLIVAVHSYGRRGAAAKRTSVQSFALLLWLLSPVGGAAATFLLRIPLIQLASLVFAQRRAMAREANRFPARIASLRPPR